MKILKKAVAIIALMTMSLSLTACNGNSKDASNGVSKENSKENSTDKKEDTVIAKVGDLSITKGDLDDVMMQADYYLQSYYGPNFKENPEYIPQYNQMLDSNLEQLIGYEIIVMKAKENKEISIDEDEIDKEVASVKSQFPTEDDFNSALTEQKMTLDDLKESIKKDLYFKKMVESFKDEIAVTDEDIKNYYDQNIQQYTQKSGANLSHILVDSEDKAKEVLQKYKDGKSFEDLAAEYGTDGTKDKGGALGYIEYDTQDYDKDFMAGAKEVAEGQVSDPVKSQFGWHLIKADGIQKEDKVKSLDEVKDQIKQTIIDEKTNDAINKAVDGWKAELKIETYKDKYQLEMPETTDNSSTSDTKTKDSTDENEKK